MKEFSLLKIYLVIISIVWLVGAVIWYGNFTYQIIKYRLITPEEYVLGSYDNYSITQCENPMIVPSKEQPSTTITQNRTPEEITKCKEEAKKNMLARRSFEYKDNLISWIIWGTVFLILFVTHFPVFYRKYRQDNL